MVTYLKPRHRTPNDAHVDIASESLPGNADSKDDQTPGREPGVELSEDDSGSGTGSAPGEGPNPTA